MIVLLLSTVTLSLLWLPCFSIHVSEIQSSKRFIDGITNRHSFNSIPAFITRRRSFDTTPKGREIVEISSADPTTDSTLRLPNYPNDCANDRECELYGHAATAETTPLPTFKPYSQEELNLYLKKFVDNNGRLPSNAVVTEEPSTNKLANLYMAEPVNIIEGTAKDEGKSQQTSKSWQLMQAQSHKHPYDDHTGWVSLEPVAWSASQVQKWEPNNKPKDPPPSHWTDNDNGQQQHPTWNRPSSSWQENNRPWNKKPTYEYKPSSRPPTHWNEYDSGSQWNGDKPEIITDSRPSSFPHYEPTKKPDWQDRPQTGYNNDYNYNSQHRPSSHPSEGDGHWVLLSSTKGYSVPQRSRANQRSLFINAKTPPNSSQYPPTSMKSHRSVRLMVLPALNGTINTTTSHGGLLEVEKTFQTVDEAQREHAAKMMRLENTNQEKSNEPKSQKRSATTVKIYPLRSTNLEANSKATLAAVGAGMLPATVAMLVPMVMGRRRRSLHEHIHQVLYNIPHRVFDT